MFPREHPPPRGVDGAWNRPDDPARGHGTSGENATGGPRPPIAGRGLYWNRRTAGLSHAARLRLHVRRDELLASLAGVERDIDELTRVRLGALAEADELRDQLWPIVPEHKGRRPPSLGRPPLPPVAPGARPIAGRALRATCLEVLRSQGELDLPSLHAWLHHYGYVIDSGNGPKVLADAMGYEVELGRAVRVRWGVYDLHPDARRSHRGDGALVDP